MSVIRKINDKLIYLDINCHLRRYTIIYCIVSTVLSILYIPFIILLLLGAVFSIYMFLLYLYGDFDITILLYPKSKSMEKKNE